MALNANQSFRDAYARSQTKSQVIVGHTAS